jgi:tetratricopeptide (TPR) repeat protein
MDAKQLKEEGMKLYREARYEEAAAKFVEAQQAAVAAGDQKEAVECINNRGVCWRQAAKLDEATAAFEEARTAFQALGDSLGEGQVIGNLAALAESKGDIRQAMELYQQAADVFEQLDAQEYVKDTYTALSKLKLKQRDFMGAIATFDAGLEQLDHPNLVERVARKILGGGSPAKQLEDKSEDSADEEQQAE